MVVTDVAPVKMPNGVFAEPAVRPAATPRKCISAANHRPEAAILSREVAMIRLQARFHEEVENTQNRRKVIAIDIQWEYMSGRIPRRFLLGGMVAVVASAAGCLDSIGDDTGSPADEDTPQANNHRCPKEARTENAAGDPIDVTVQQSDADHRIEAQCESSAGEAALAALEERIDEPVETDDGHLIAGRSTREGAIIEWITNVTETGRYVRCPEIEFETVVSHTPRRVSVHIERDDVDDYECSHRITVRSSVIKDD